MSNKTDIENNNTKLEAISSKMTAVQTKADNLHQVNLQSLNITPSTSPQSITPTGNVDGYNSISVNAVTSSIDNNIVAGNIKKDVTILGVTGTYEGGGSTPIYFEDSTTGVMQNLKLIGQCYEGTGVLDGLYFYIISYYGRASAGADFGDSNSCYLYVGVYNATGTDKAMASYKINIFNSGGTKLTNMNVVLTATAGKLKTSSTNFTYVVPIRTGYSFTVEPG